VRGLFADDAFVVLGVCGTLDNDGALNPPTTYHFPPETKTMTKVKQITAWVESKPGELGRITAALGKAKVNILAVTCWSAGSESPVHLQVSSSAKARKVLQKLGVRVTEEEVLRVTLPDKPGVLGEVGVLLGAGNINIEYAYASVPTGGKKADLILSVSDVAGASKALRGRKG